MERAGSPSKSMIEKSFPVKEHLTEVVVAVNADFHGVDAPAQHAT